MPWARAVGSAAVTVYLVWLIASRMESVHIEQGQHGQKGVMIVAAAVIISLHWIGVVVLALGTFSETQRWTLIQVLLKSPADGWFCRYTSWARRNAVRRHRQGRRKVTAVKKTWRRGPRFQLAGPAAHLTEVAGWPLRAKLNTEARLLRGGQQALSASGG